MTTQIARLDRDHIRAILTGVVQFLRVGIDKLRGEETTFVLVQEMAPFGVLLQDLEGQLGLCPGLAEPWAGVAHLVLCKGGEDLFDFLDDVELEVTDLFLAL